MKQEELIERKLKNVQGINFIDVEGTPFQILQDTKHATCSITCGKVRLETECKTEEETIKWMKYNYWKLVSLLAQATFYELSKQ